MEQIGLGRHFGAQPLDELPVFLGALALDHDCEVVLRGELVLEAEEILVVLLVGAHQVLLAQVKGRV